MEAHCRSETCPSEASSISAAASEGHDKKMMKMKEKVVKGSSEAADHQPQRVLLDLKLSNDDSNRAGTSNNMELNLFNSMNAGSSLIFFFSIKLPLNGVCLNSLRVCLGLHRKIEFFFSFFWSHSK